MREYIDKSGIENPGEKKLKSFWEMLEEIFFRNAVDALYFWLGLFTYLYLFLVGFLYLAGLSFHENLSTKIVQSLAEPYLGAAAIYTILKESRKRVGGSPSRHWGEVFVTLWFLLLVFSSAAALFSDAFVFNDTLELIIKLALSVGIIYVGGAIHRP